MFLTYPITPISMETIENDTQIEQTILGIRKSAITTITNAVTSIVCMAWGRMAMY